ncbi:hypothetical protein C0033_04645 [Clostridium sp. chh4-2]|nr:hypothetical protein C0033_04645 [Clostridium sp. chh4-2]
MCMEGRIETGEPFNPESVWIVKLFWAAELEGNMKKRITALTMACVMCASLLAGCGGKSEQPSSASAGSSAQGETTAKTTEAEAPKEAPVIVIYNNSGAFNVAGAEAGSEAAAYEKMQNYILEQTGVKVEIIMPPSDSGAAKEKLNLLLAGGDQIDAWWGNWHDYAPSGMILPLNTYIENDEYKAIKDAWEPWGSWIGTTDTDGTIWSVPRNTSTTPYPIFVRQDWLDLVGMEQPSTLDELNEYLYKIKELDPYGNGETIPLGTQKGGEVMAYLEYSLLGGFVDTGNGSWLDEDGKVKPVWIADGYKDFLAQLNTWYKDGILHKECFSMDKDTFIQSITKGAVGATAAWYSRITLNDGTLTKNLPDLDLEKYDYAFGINEKGITGPNGKFVQTRTNVSPEGLMISSKCKNPDAVMKFVEWSYHWENYQTAAMGIKDEYWKYDPNDPDAEKNRSVVAIEGGPKYCRDFLVSLGTPMEIQSTEYDEWGRQTMHNLWLQEHLNDFDVTHEPGCEYGITWQNDKLTENIPAYTDIRTYRDEELVKFVNGNRSLDTWDDFVQELYGMGLEDWITEYTRQYNESK